MWASSDWNHAANVSIDGFRFTHFIDFSQCTSGVNIAIARRPSGYSDHQLRLPDAHQLRYFTMNVVSLINFDPGDRYIRM